MSPRNQHRHIGLDRLFNAALQLIVLAFPFDLCQADGGFTFQYLGAGIRDSGVSPIRQGCTKEPTAPPTSYANMKG